VNDFWLTVMTTHPMVSRKITTEDEPALRYLNDVRLRIADDTTVRTLCAAVTASLGWAQIYTCALCVCLRCCVVSLTHGRWAHTWQAFTLEFSFDPNEFFADTVLTKTYILENPANQGYDDLVYARAEGYGARPDCPASARALTMHTWWAAQVQDCLEAQQEADGAH
jgi:hypothetical protein